MKILVANYTFNAAAKTVTFTDYGSIVLERIFVISNSTDGILIFNFADAGVTGTVSANVLTLAYDTASMSDTDRLLIIYDDPAVTTQAVSGTITANAGTNLNTSALATSAKQDTLLTELQLKADLTETQPVSLASVPSHPVTNAGTFAVQDTGGVLAALQVMDDWDETNRAAVNPITGQVGVAANTGLVSANTQRVVQAYNADWIPLRTNYTSLQTNVVVLAAAGGQRIVVKKVSALLDNATSVDVQVRIGFAAATTPTGAGVILTHPGLTPPGMIEDYGPDGVVGADGEDVLITSEAPTGGSLDVLLVYKIV